MNKAELEKLAQEAKDKLFQIEKRLTELAKERDSLFQDGFRLEGRLKALADLLANFQEPSE